MTEVSVYSGNYVPPNKTFAEKYMPQLVHIYERQPTNPNPPKKVVIFDLDETIGSFGDLYFLWKSLHLENTYPPPPESMRRFHQMLSLYPEMFRPGIFAVIEYIYRKIQKGIAYPVHVYTNTQCDAPAWVDMILSYIEHKVIGPDDSGQRGRVLFADPICAFKIGGKRVNLKRTTQHKTPADFVKCSLIPRNTEICFVDDQTHDSMKTGKIYYIQPPPYYHPLSREEIMDRFSRSELYSVYFSGPNTTKPTKLFLKPDVSNDVSIGKKIMYYVREFFLLGLPPSQYSRRKRTGCANQRCTRSKRKPRLDG